MAMWTDDEIRELVRNANERWPDVPYLRNAAALGAIDAWAAENGTVAYTDHQLLVAIREVLAILEEASRPVSS